MTQEYTPVEWVDETENQVGTIINKARLDQMQTAHHFADGFKEVDTVPTADPGVNYHMVVFCTADTTFYRWNGTQWVKDVDDSTLALLEAHEADHNNPHVVTKDQVGLGNVDNKASVSSWQTTPDNDHIPTEKLVKDGLDAKVDDTQIVSAFQGTPDNTHIASEKLTKDSLDAKLDDSQLVTSWSGTVSDTNIPSEKLVKDSLDLKINTVALVSAWQLTPDDSHIPTEKLVKTYIDTSLTDGSVTKIGTVTVGGNLKPVYLNAGVPTAVANNLVDVSTVQTITSKKIYKVSPTYVALEVANDTAYTSGNQWGGCLDFMCDNGTKRVGRIVARKDGASAGRLVLQVSDSGTGNIANDVSFINNGSAQYLTAPSRTYNSANVTDVVTIGSLASNPNVMHTTGNETINGIKTFQSEIRSGSYASFSHYEDTATHRVMMSAFNGNTEGRVEIRVANDGTVILLLRKVVNGQYTDYMIHSF